MKAIKCLFIVALLIPMPLAAQQATWELVRSDFWGKIAIDATNSDIIYVSPGRFPEFGLHKSTDGGKTWTYFREGYEGLDDVKGILVDPKNPQRLWVYGGPGKGVIRSEDGGLTAVRSDSGIYSDHHGYSVSAFAYDSKRDILYAGDLSAGGIYRSFNSGRSWELILAYGLGLMFNPVFFLMQEDSGWLYSGSGAQGAWRSKDFGVSWTSLQPDLLGNQPVRFIAKVPNSSTLYCLGGEDGNIYKSYNLGERWDLISDATTDSSELSGGLVISSIDTNFIYVGGSAYGAQILKGGFFLSHDAGKSWQRYHVGLPEYDLSQYTVWSLTQTSSSSYLYLSLLVGDQSKHSVFRLSQTLLTPIQKHPYSSIPAIFSLQQNYPNPFNAQTNIHFSVPGKEVTTLDIYNMAGVLVKRLFNGRLNAGGHSVTWDGKNSKGGDAASGIYLIRLKSGQESLIRKMVLIR